MPIVAQCIDARRLLFEHRLLKQARSKIGDVREVVAYLQTPILELFGKGLKPKISQRIVAANRIGRPKRVVPIALVVAEQLPFE